MHTNGWKDFQHIKEMHPVEMERLVKAYEEELESEIIKGKMN